MAHTNNAKRKTRTHSVLPKKRAKVSTRAHTHSDYAEVEVPHEPPVEATREEQAAIITEYHALEKQLAQTTDLLERRLITNRQEELGGLEGYQKASIHGGDKVRGGESGKWLCGALQEMREATKAGRKVLAKGKPTIMEKVRCCPSPPQRVRIVLTGTDSSAGRWCDCRDSIRCVPVGRGDFNRHQLPVRQSYPMRFLRLPHPHCAGGTL